jgi:hypothetical protein
LDTAGNQVTECHAFDDIADTGIGPSKIIGRILQVFGCALPILQLGGNIIQFRLHVLGFRFGV